MAKESLTIRIASFKFALNFLTHPASLAAAGLLLLNDTLFRSLWPGWWTGKLGDAAWLFFVPYLLAAGLCWLIPVPGQGESPAARDARRTHRQWSFCAAFLVTGLVFSLVKAVPGINALAVSAIVSLTGETPALRLDPGDLLALVGLAVSAAMWLGTERRLASRTAGHQGLPQLTWPRLAALPLVLLILMGDAVPADRGFMCFIQGQGEIIAKAGFQSYRSTDGGLTWQANPPGESPDCEPSHKTVAGWVIVPGPQPAQAYRYQEGQPEIQVSNDGGQTWQTAYRIPAASQAEQIYLARSHAGNPLYQPGPLDAVADPTSGNMLFAMGLRGVLVRTAQGEWQWSMGDYHRLESFPTLDAFGNLLGGMLALAVGLALILYAALALRWTRRWPRVLVLTLAALAWLGVDLLFSPATTIGYLLTVTWVGLLVMAVLILPLVIEQTVRLMQRAPRALPTLAGIALAGGVLYFIPYLLWLYNLIPDFAVANGIALALAVLVLIVGVLAARGYPKIPPVPPGLGAILTVVALLTLSACTTGQIRGPQRWVIAVPSPTPAQADSALGVTPTPVPPQQPLPDGPRLLATHRSGQTFLTWSERTDLQGERYRIYRASRPITAATLAQATRLAEVGKNSARFYASMFVEDGVWKYRYAPRLIIQDNGSPTPDGVGLLVWTVGSEDFDGQSSGSGYYAVTITPAGGEETFSADYTTGPLAEQVADPLPVEITHSPGTVTSEQSHVYVQYMDLRHWNPTYHAPNSTNAYYGFDPSDPDLAAALAYAYDYQVFTPTAETCGGQVPESLPVMLFLHGARTNRYGSVGKNPYPHCAYSLYPIDQSDTWYFGFARSHDYRRGGVVGADDVIENYTERRVLRMIADLMRHPPGPAVDPQRVYVFGHSMGGSGTLGFVERYPNVFAAGYSGEPISDYRTAGVTKGDWVANVSVKWGAPALNLPIHIAAPNDWAQPLQKYNGVGVWDWQNYLGNLTAEAVPERIQDEMAPFGIDHGINDDVILWPTQGQVFYPALASVARVWSGAVTDAGHEWADFLALPPSMAKQDGHPFWNLQVRRDESLPALSHLSSNLSGLPGAPTTYNQTVKWSSSWDAWDGAPVDQAERWEMSFCAVEPGSTTCGSGATVSASITPRRLQHFAVQPGQRYDWENRRVSDRRLVDRGTVTADADGLIIVPDFTIIPSGSRLVLTRHP